MVWRKPGSICLRRSAVSVERAISFLRCVLSSPGGGNQVNRGALREDRKGGEARSQRHDLHLVCGWADRTFRKHAGIREATPSARNPLRSYTLQSNTYLVDHTFIHVFNIIPFRTIERLSRCNKRLAGNAPLNGEWVEILRRNRERDGKYNWSQAWINVD